MGRPRPGIALTLHCSCHCSTLTAHASASRPIRRTPPFTPRSHHRQVHAAPNHRAPDPQPPAPRLELAQLVRRVPRTGVHRRYPAPNSFGVPSCARVIRITTSHARRRPHTSAASGAGDLESPNTIIASRTPPRLEAVPPRAGTRQCPRQRGGHAPMASAPAAAQTAAPLECHGIDGAGPPRRRKHREQASVSPEENRVRNT